MRTVFPGLIATGLLLSGCAAVQGFLGVAGQETRGGTSTELPSAAPVTAVPLDPPPPSANTAAALDTTTPQDRAAALAAPLAPSGEQRLGTTLATLGSPTDPGIWIKTGLVTRLAAGRIDYQGTSINIELRPSGGAVDAGSQISLAAMRLLNAPLTGIVEVTVFAGGAG